MVKDFGYLGSDDEQRPRRQFGMLSLVDNFIHFEFSGFVRI